MKTTFGVAVALIALSVVAFAQMRAGRWDTTMQMQMAGSPIQMPEMKGSRCITPEDAKDPSRSLPSGPEGRGQKSDCKVSDYKTSGSTVTWKMACTGMTGTGEMTYANDSYTGTMKMETP